MMFEWRGLPPRDPFVDQISDRVLSYSRRFDLRPLALGEAGRPPSLTPYLGS